MSEKVIVAIPARYGSTRFEGKVLADIGGKTVLQSVWENVLNAKTVSKVIIATDDERVYKEALRFGATVKMTSTAHACGTDRIVEAIKDEDADIVVNVQGDEPLIRAEQVDIVVNPLLENPKEVMSTLSFEIKDQEIYNDPSVVKVITDKSDYAIYFSRWPIPYNRDNKNTIILKKHIGIYAFRKSFMIEYASWDSTPLENAEKLEQLRVLENGYKIKVEKSPWDTFGVDKPEDLEEVRKIICRM
ncbi:MAG: 3-deoxy-manno-octulosonate cytidylyltransferase [Candidatus Theseobacter exili]|nr:3-deoxy-manno-octulosonate cytidylyltransferase [Candidatus Theseobacter exili]